MKIKLVPSFVWKCALPITLMCGAVYVGGKQVNNILTTHQANKDDKLLRVTNPPQGASPLSWYMECSSALMKKEEAKLINLRDTLLLNFTKIGGISMLQVGDSHYNNYFRLNLSSTNLKLFIITTDDSYLKDAFNVLDEGLVDHDPALIWHKSIPYVREYFELKLAKADLHLMVSRLEEKKNETGFRTAVDLAQEIIDEINDPEMRQAMNVIEESIPGYTARARLIQARAYESLNNPLEAKALYEQVIEWSNKQTEPGLTNAVRNIYAEGKLINASLGILYVGSLARIQLGYILMTEGKFDEAFQLFIDVVNWEKIGAEDGPIDLGFAALIGAMRTGNGFDGLPWEKIQGYDALLEALNIDIDEFSEASNNKKAEMLIEKLSLTPLDEKMRTQLRLLKMGF